MWYTEDKKTEYKIRYQIRHNVVREVEKYDDWQEGITSEGFDVAGNSIFVKNLDAGKSKELMRIVLEGDYMEGRSLKIIIALLVWWILSWLVIYFLFFSWDKENTTPNAIGEAVIESNSIISNPIITANPQDNVQEDIEQQDEDIQLNDSNIYQETQFQIQNLKLENNRLSFQYETIKSDYALQSDINNNLESKVAILESQKEELSRNILSLEKTIQEKDIEILKISKNTTETSPDEFLCYLGSEVYKMCEKSSETTEKNACKDLYYNFLKK